MSDYRKIQTEKAPAAIGPYSQAMVACGLVFTSGQIPARPADGGIPEGIEAQAKQSMENLGAILEAAGSGFENVGTYMIVGLIGLNFVFELIVDIVLSPIVVRLISVGKKGKAV